MNKENTPNDLRTYTVAEVSALTGLKKDKIYVYLRGGQLPCLKMGHTRIRHEALAEFLKKMETTQYWD